MKLTNYDTILDNLYNKHYKNLSSSLSVTSSHWSDSSPHQLYKVSKGEQKGQYHMTGGGFGFYSKATWFHKIRILPIVFLLSNILRKYNCQKNIVNAGKQVNEKINFLLSYDNVKTMLSLNLIVKVLNKSNIRIGDKESVKIICIIGDGYGFFSNLLRQFEPSIKVISINLGKTLLFDVQYSKACFPDIDVALIRSMQDKELLFENDISFIEAENYHFLQDLPIDMFINVASMQEMNPEIVENYFNYMRGSSRPSPYFYCCNRVEKSLPDGTIINFFDYPWKNKDKVIVDELCPWYQKFPYFSLKIFPIWRPFDGPIWHRLLKF